MPPRRINDSYCCFPKCRALSDVILLGHGLCDKHWAVVAEDAKARKRAGFDPVPSGCLAKAATTIEDTKAAVRRRIQQRMKESQ